MELREFIKNSLVDILGGIQDAQAHVQNDENAKGAVVPIFGELSDNIEKIEFDIAVTVSTEKSGKVDAGIKIAVPGLGKGGFGAGLGQRDSDSKVSRLKFSVPVAPSALAVISPAPSPTPKRNIPGV